MADNGSRAKLLAQASEVLQAAEREAKLMRANPEIVAAYAGEWVAVRDGRVIAHARDGAELGRIVSSHNYKDAIVGYVPTAEEQQGVFILTPGALRIEVG